MCGKVCGVRGRLYSAARRTSLRASSALREAAACECDLRGRVASQHIQQRVDQRFLSVLELVLVFSAL